MIVRVRGRRAFQRLLHDGTRIRRAALWCSWCPDPPSTSTAIAFAIGRSCGPAAARNRLRRRLRAIVRELDRTDPLPPGLLLIGATPSATELTFGQLTVELTELVATVRSRSGSRT